MLAEAVNVRLKEIIREASGERQAEVIGLKIMSDHMRPRVEVNPPFGIHRLVRLLKG